MTYKIILVKIDQRIQEAGVVQSLLTKFGCNIKVRLGLHEVSSNACAQDGLIVLHVDGVKDELNQLIDKLNSIEYVQAKLIEM